MDWSAVDYCDVDYSDLRLNTFSFLGELFL